MHWPSLAALAVAFAIGSYRLGALTVWVAALSFALKAALVAVAAAIVVITVAALRRRLGR